MNLLNFLVDLLVFWDMNNINSYATNVIILSLQCPNYCIECDISCECLQHKNFIPDYCESLVKLLKDTVLINVKQNVVGFAKPYCSNELPKLKRFSVEAHAVWTEHSRLMLGVLNDNRLLCKSKY